MSVSSYFDARLARLLADWLTSSRWNEALFDLIRGFLDEVRFDSSIHGKFAADEEAAESQKKAVWKALTEIAGCESENPAFASLAARFSLSPAEIALLEFFNLYMVFNPLETYVDKLPEGEALRKLACCCGTGEHDIIEALGPHSAMLSSGLGTNDGHALRLPKHGITFGLPEHVLAFIAKEGNQPLVSFLLETPSIPCLPLSAYDLPSRTLATARTTLSATHGKPFLLVYGKPGTGKSEFARSLSVSCGYTPCFIRHDRSTGNRSYSNLLLAARLVDPEREVLVVDEADELLNLKPNPFGSGDANGAIKKSMINDFLDFTKSRIIFITNETWRIPDAILRRFTFHLGFEDFTLGQRTRIWNEMDSDTRIFSAKERAVLAARYKANPSRIRQVFDVCSSLGNGESVSAREALNIAHEMLARGDELLHGIARREKREASTYDPAFLNLGTPATELLDSLERWKTTCTQRTSGINLLFFGVPGTGKTAFALHLAEQLGFQPIIKRASDLLSAWVGETEKKIRDAFKEAEGAVLIFDEADSLLSSREEARTGWERTMTNEVLTCMEDFKGIFIASTNFRAILDEASFRRFTFKVEFKPTASAQRKRLVESYFPGLSLPEATLTELAALDSLTPGDVATAANRLQYSSSCDGQKVFAAIKEELVSREPRQVRIGFLA